MIESWMINIVILIVGIVGTYAVLRARVSRLEKDYSDHIEQSEKRVSDIYLKINSESKEVNLRVDAGFKRLDTVSKEVTVLERDSAKFLDLPAAEARFVTRKELDLHLEKIEIITGNTNKEVGLLMGKQDSILDILHKMSQKE